MQLAAFLGNPAMSQPSPVADYLDNVARDLAFDPALSRRVRQEIEDHLREAAMAEAAESPIDAENRAIMKFGAPQEIAGQYRALSLHMRMKKTGLLVLCATLAAFGAMESRAVWYGLTRWDIGTHLKTVGQTIIPIDRCAFALAIAFGVVGSIYVTSRPIPLGGGQPSRSHIRWGQFLLAAAAGATAVAVTCEIIVTTWRLVEAHWTTNSLLPLTSIISEIGIVSGALLYIRNTIRRASAMMRHAVMDDLGSGKTYC
jgi:hypothetical protein